MMKNVTRYIDRCFIDESGLDPSEEANVVQANDLKIQQIEQKLNSRQGQADLHYPIRELSGGFKTNYSTTETFAQAQVSLLSNKRVSRPKKL